MSHTTNLNGVEVPATVKRIEAQDDMEQGGEISENLRLSQHDSNAHDENGCSGDHHDQHDVTNAPIKADSLKSPRTNDKPTSVNEEKSEHSQPQATGAVSMNGERSDENMEKLVGLFREFLEAASNPGPGASRNNSDPQHTQRNTAGRKRLFGLTKGIPSESGSTNRYDYEQKYPRDQFGEETAPNARIWLTYLDEAETFDRERVEGWKDTVDVLLVFAGLFSSVITTFISQASQNLQQDNTQVTASLAFETVQILRAHLSGIPISTVPSSTITPNSPFTPSTNASLVNGLWFTSLATTLSAALFAVLAKQWLYYYMTSISGTPNQKVRARQLRFNGFEEWKVAAIVDLLPILLHLAVGLFLTGIMILLFPLDARIAWTIVAITGITFTLYFVSVILPVWYPECPYTTSLTIYAGILFFFVRESHRWISAILDQGFRVIWERVNFQAQHTIQHLCDYVLGLFRSLFTFISKLGGHVRRTLGRHQPSMFYADLPKFTKWREENIKQAVKNATILDSQAVNWLYMTSADRSVQRIIARAVAVCPAIAEQFEVNSRWILPLSLEVTETNVQDLRHGLCLGLLSNGLYQPHWDLLEHIPDVAKSELEEEEFKTYLRISEYVPMHRFAPSAAFLERLISITDDNSIKLPLSMWCYFLRMTPRNDTMAAQIVKPRMTNLFYWQFDPTRELVHSAGLVQFDSDELGWWKLEYLFDYFSLGKPDCSSEAKSHETRHILFIAIYRHLTSNDPFITNEAERRVSLCELFESFRWRRATPWTPEYRFKFFKEILCLDSFWSECMTDSARYAALQCLDPVWYEEATFPYMDRDDLSLVYQWCSRNDGVPLSSSTSTIFTILLMPQNLHHLSTILSNDPEAASNLSACLRNLGYCCHPSEQGRVIYSLLMDLLKSAKTPLFTVLYNTSVLVELWSLGLQYKQDMEQFFLLVKSKLDGKESDELLAAMSDNDD